MWEKNVPGTATGKGSEHYAYYDEDYPSQYRYCDSAQPACSEACFVNLSNSKALITLELLNCIVIESSRPLRPILQAKSRLMPDVAVASQLYALTSEINNLYMEGDRMSAEKKKGENPAEKTGEAVGKGVRKSAKAVNDFGKGIKKGLKKKE